MDIKENLKGKKSNVAGAAIAVSGLAIAIYGVELLGTLLFDFFPGSGAVQSILDNSVLIGSFIASLGIFPILGSKK